MSDLPLPYCLEIGDGEPVLFLHGIGGESSSFIKQMERLADNGFRCLSWDMPGYGKSAPLPDLTFARLAEVAVNILKAHKISAAHIVGHSIGGMITQEILARHAKRVKSAVLYGAPPAFGGRDDQFKEQFLSARLKPLDDGKTMLQVAEKVVPAMVGEDADQAGIQTAVASMAKVSPLTYRAVLKCLVTFDQRENLGKIKVPVLITGGSKDPNAPLPTLQRMQGKIPGSSLHLIEGAGHLAHLERPGAFNAILEQFLTSEKVLA